MADCNGCDDDTGLAGVSIGGEIVPTTLVPGVGEVAELACTDEVGEVTEPVFPDTPDCACAVRRLCPYDVDGELIEWWELCEQDGRCKWRPSIDAFGGLLFDEFCNLVCIKPSVQTFGYNGNPSNNIGGIDDDDESAPFGPFPVTVSCGGDYLLSGVLDFFPDVAGGTSSYQIQISDDGGATWRTIPPAIGTSITCMASAACSERESFFADIRLQSGTTDLLFRIRNTGGGQSPQWGPDAFVQVAANVQTYELVKL